MRSRYTAFTRGAVDYLTTSWHPDHRPKTIAFDPDVQWLGLEIVDVSAGGPEDLVGEVEFVARFRREGQRAKLHERSRFERHDGRWVYVDGDLLS